MRVAGIEVGDELFGRWKQWFAPEVQPFVVAGSLRSIRGSPVEPPAEMRDTFALYRVGGARIVVISAAEFAALPRAHRAKLVRDQHHRGRALVPSVRSAPVTLRDAVRLQADGHRYVWWPSLIAGHERAIVDAQAVAGMDDAAHSRHRRERHPKQSVAGMAIDSSRHVRCRR